MATWLTFDATGRIKQRANGQITLEPGCSELQAEGRAKTHYIADPGGTPTVTAKGLITATWDKQTVDADGVDIATLSGLPIPCTITADDTPVVVIDGTYEFAATSPGEYSVRIDEVEFEWADWVINAD